MRNAINTIVSLCTIVCLSNPLMSQTSLTKYAGNPVLTPGPDAWDAGVSGPSVLLEATIYKMWYTGTDGTANGSAIGYATSPDGINWTKYSGNPILSGVQGEWDLTINDICVIFVNGQYLMYYSGAESGSSFNRIGLATSSDGINWTKYGDNPILTNGPSGAWDQNLVRRPSVLYDGNIYHIWYEGHRDRMRIGYATSIDGVDWQKYSGNPVVDISSISGSFDELVASGPSVVWDGCQFVMSYSGHGERGIGVAFSTDRVTWQKSPENPVLIPATSGASDLFIGQPYQLLDGDTYKIWYNTFNGSSSGLGYAEGPQDPVGDDTPPVPDVTHLPDAPGECSVTLTAPTATDNCAGSITASTTDPTTYTTQGTFSVTWAYDDGNGNTSQQTQNVIVDDVTAPVITLNGDNPMTVIRFSGPYVEPGAAATDNCNPSPALAISGTVDTNLPGVYPVTYDADDGNGNTSQVIRTVNVIDDQNALAHPYLYLADKKIMLDKMGQSDGDMHSNDEIDIKKGPAIFAGDVTAVGKIDIAKKVTIEGDVTAGDELQLDKNVTITGTATEFASVSSVALPSLSYSAGGNDVKVKKNQTQALTPGSYGKIEVEENGTLQFSSGDYFCEELILKKDVNLEISLATGPVAVNVEKKVDMDKDVSMSLSPLGDVDSRYVTINSMEDIQIGKGSVLRGTFNVPQGKFDLKKNGDLIGAICAEEIAVDKDAIAVHHNEQEIPAMPLAGTGSPINKLSGEDIRMTQSDGDGELESEASSSTGDISVMPDQFALGQNYPNPFNPSTTITFDVPEAGEVTLSIYNMRGQLVLTLYSGGIAAGQHSSVWDGRDFRGAKVASGVYLYQLKARGFVATRKLVFTK